MSYTNYLELELDAFREKRKNDRKREKKHETGLFPEPTAELGANSSHRI